MTTKNAKPEVSTKQAAAVVTEVNLLTAPALAKRLNLKPTHLRRILRSMDTYNDGIHTKYGWDETTKAGQDAVKAISSEVARRKGAPSDKQMEAKAATATKAA
jgi:hypothetical protein